MAANRGGELDRPLDAGGAKPLDGARGEPVGQVLDVAAQRAALPGTRLLAAVDAAWLGAHRAALTERRDLLTALINAQLPAWRTRTPDAGLSLWAELPLDNADAFTLVAARQGVTVMTGSAACADGRHRHFVRLSFAEQPSTLELAVERLAAAWELHAETLAASPART